MALRLYSLKMLGTESECSLCVSHALEIWNSRLCSELAIFWLNSATSRVVMPRRSRSSFSCSLGSRVVTAPYLTSSSLESRWSDLYQRKSARGQNLCLLADHTEVTRDAEPLAILFHPGVRETPLMLIGFPLERTLLVSGADDDDGIAVAVKFHVIRRFHGELVGLVANGFQELGLRHDHSVVVGEDEVIIQQFPHGIRVMVELHLVPEILERDDFCFVSLCPGNTLRKGQAREDEKERKSTAHGISSFGEIQNLDRRCVSSEDATKTIHHRRENLTTLLRSNHKVPTHCSIIDPTHCTV